MFALDLLQQYQSMNGCLLAAGKIYVYKLGRTELAPVYGDHNGATVIANPVILDDQGMAEIYLNDAFNYTIVVFDAYGQEQFSRDIYPSGMGKGESIGTQLYEGIDPIVVNNDVYAISANTTKLGVQDPLYFVQDDAERVIIGFSGHTDVPPGTMNESAFGYEDGQITSYNGSAFSAGNSYEAGSYVDITNNTISVTGLTPVPADTASTGLVASVSADITAMIPDTSDMATQTWVNEQGFLTAHQDLSDYAKTEDLTAYYPASNPSGFITGVDLSDYVTTTELQNVSGEITAMIPTALTGEYVAGNNESGFAITSMSGSINVGENEYLGSQAIGIAKSNSGIVLSPNQIEIYGNGVDEIINANDISALKQLSSEKADVTALTAYQEITGMTAYQSAGDYYSASNPSGFITEVPAGTMNESAFEYDASNNITAYNGSALAGGLTGDYVSGYNTAFVQTPFAPEGIGTGYSAIISGDIQVITGNYYNGDGPYNTGTYSFSGMYNELASKLNGDYVNDSTTIKNINDHAEMADSAYRPNGFIINSAYDVNTGSGPIGQFANILFINNNTNFYSAIIIAATDSTGTLPGGWSLQSYEDGSAILTKQYGYPGPQQDQVSLKYFDGWNVTACDASAMVYSSMELAKIAFKDDITGITYTTGSI